MLKHVSRAFFNSALNRGAKSVAVVVGVVVVANRRLDMREVNAQTVSLQVLARQDPLARILALYYFFFLLEIGNMYFLTEKWWRTLNEEFLTKKASGCNAHRQGGSK